MANNRSKVKRKIVKITFITVLQVVFLVSAMGDAFAAKTSSRAQDEAVRTRVSKSYWRLPLRFEANQGQTDNRVKFLSRGLGYNLFLTSGEAVFSLRSNKTFREKDNSKRDSKTQKRTAATVFSIQLMGVNPSIKSRGLDRLPIKTNYLIGNDPRTWHQDIPTYAKVEFKELYAGIDLVYYGNQRRLEFDFLVRPGADHKSIRMKFKNVNHLNLDRDGNLILSVAGGKILLEKPLIYQQVDGKKRTVSGHYKLQPENIVGFHVATYDSKIPLVIDPVLNYSTYLGGDSDDLGNGIAVDVFGNAYVTGATQSNDFPTTEDAFQEDRDSFRDVFVSKFNAEGTELVYSTYLGGNSDDLGNDVAVDSSGNAHVTGFTQSNNFPTTEDAFEEDRQSLQDAFVTKLNSDGSDLVYSTYLGGSLNDDSGNGIALDSSGNAYIVGTTQSTTFPTTTGAFQEDLADLRDVFVTKLNPDPTLADPNDALIYSTYLGGNNDDFGNGIAVDSAGNSYIVGTTRSTDFPTTSDAFQEDRQSLNDAFVSKLNSDGSDLLFSTYLGGDFDDLGNDIAVDSSANTYVTGTTQSNNFPTEDAFQENRSSLRDAFVTKVNQSGEALLYSTYIGGSADDLSNSVAVDSEGNAYIVGATASVDFPTTTGAFEETQQGAQDAFVSKLDPFGDTFIYSTYLGGTGDDFGNGIAVDSSGNAYVTGTTESGDFPTVNFFDNSLGGAQDAFVTKLNSTGTAPLEYSTYLGGSGSDSGNDIAVDSSGNAYVTGTTQSGDFPTQNPFQAANAGSNDAFVTKFNAAGSALTYSTYLGGSGSDFGNGIAVDSSDDAYVTGTTESGDFPTVNFFDNLLGGARDAFVSKFDPSLAGVASLLYSTYLGGSMDDFGNSIAVDTSNNAYVTGTTDSTDFPTQAPIQAANAGLNDTFISKFNAAGSALTYSTYLGGSGSDFGNGIAVDISDNAYITGTTESDDFPTENAFQANRGGLQDSFVSKVNAAGDTLVYSSYLGGSNDDLGNDVAVDGLGNAFIAGSTLSNDFPTKSVQDTPGGLNDGFVAKVQEAEETDSSTGGDNESGGGSSGGDCFISTAAYGSPMARQFQLLSAIFILLALLCTILFVLYRRLKLRELVFRTARLKSK